MVKKRVTSLLLCICCSGLVFGLGGCAFSSKAKNIAAFKDPDKFLVSTDTYTLNPPDEILIQCTRVPEINEQRQRIRPDGKIRFEGLGEFEIAGKTPSEVADLIKAKATELYKDEALPGEDAIDVRVTAFQSKSIYVLGQVDSPGRKLFTGRDTVLSVLADARPNPMAWNERVQVIRPSGEQKLPPKVFELNYYQMIIYGDLRKNVLLEEGDIVYVPPTPFAAVALTLEQILRPIARAFTGAYYLNTNPVDAGSRRLVGGY